jgi:cytochrome c
MSIRLSFLAASVAGAVCALGAQAMAQDAGAGKMIYLTHCGICHTVEAGHNRIGPSLFGVVGRKAGTVADFNYSDANKNSGLTWDTATLERYINDPRGVIPGTTMSYGGIQDPAQRANLIAYLATLH